MESRVKKYYTKDIETDSSSHSTRSSRNANLYRHIYGKYEDLDNLPLEDNTNEIDMEKLRELVLNNNSKKEEKKIKEDLNILEQRKRRIDEQKLYDINKILEKAKYENSKLKEPVSIVSKPQRDILSTLESTELSLIEIKKAKEQYQEQQNEIHNNYDNEEALSMTRELKYKNLDINQVEEKTIENSSISNTQDLSFDLFEELKPTGNTITTKPIKSEINNDIIKNDIRSGDTSDIDIIKSSSNTTTDDFFTNSYEFSKKDFADPEDDDFFEQPKKGGLFKIIILILAIIIFVGVIIYFIGTYGLGIS